MLIRTQRLPRGPESGGALVFALIVATLAAAFTSGILQVSAMVTKRQAQDVDNLRAFYIAEAGLSEAFEAVRTGLRGQIGAIDAPAVYGDGFVWVDATPTPNGQLRLESTALCGVGRSTLAVVVEPVEVPLGIFSDEDLVIDEVLLVDGFDSAGAPDNPQIKIDPDYPYLHIDNTNHLLFYESTFYRFYSVAGDSYSYDHSISVMELSEIPAFGNGSDYDIDSDDFTDSSSSGGDFIDIEYEGVIAYFSEFDQPLSDVLNYVDDRTKVTRDTITETGLAPVDADLTGSEYVTNQGTTVGGFSTLTDAGSGWVVSGQQTGGTTTELDAGDGLLGSNGNITIGGKGESVQINGDVIPGAEHDVFIGAGGQVLGSTDPRPEPVELPPVEVPDVTMGAAVEHTSALPMVISPGDSGYEAIDVAADAELIIRGPATVVLGRLNLAPGSVLSLDTVDGDVELFVTTALNLAPGSTVMTSGQPEELSLQVSASASVDNQPPVQLLAQSQFYGTIYAPQAEVLVGESFELWGGIVARVLDLEPGAKLHYDAGAAANMPRIVSWKIIEVPAAVAANLGSSLRDLGLEKSELASLSQAHDLGGIDLNLDYIDAVGTERSYSGPEVDFDWTEVSEVVERERTGWDDWGSGWHNDWWDELGPTWWDQVEDWLSGWGSNWGKSTTTTPTSTTGGESITGSTGSTGGKGGKKGK